MTIASIINAIETGAQYIDAEANATFGREIAFMITEAFGGDLNAAVRFVAQGLLCETWHLDVKKGVSFAWIDLQYKSFTAISPISSRALLLATLRAMESLE